MESRRNTDWTVLGYVPIFTVAEKDILTGIQRFGMENVRPGRRGSIANII